MAVYKKRSPLPLYAAAAVWAVWGAFFPLYHITHFALVIALSVAVYLGGRVLWPDKVIHLPDPEPEPEPMPEEALAILQLKTEGERAVSEMRRLSASIGPPLTDRITRLEKTTEKIIAHVAEQPEKMGQIRRMLNYYLPTVLKLLNAYDRMDDAGVRGANIDNTKGKIEDILDTVAAAFEKQLDALFGDEALDLAADITVLEQMLAREGLGGTQLSVDSTDT